MYYQLIINETGRNSLKEKATHFNILQKTFENLPELKDYLVERYGKMPKGKGKIYRDIKDGKAQEIGFLHSFWNNDISHNSKAWFQTDWIEILEVSTRTVLI